MIHNNESNLPGRLSQKKILQVASELGFDFKSNEIYKQDIIPESKSAINNFSKLLMRNLLKRISEYQLEVRFGVNKFKKLISSVAGFGLYVFNLRTSSFQSREYRASVIEKFVSDKHYQALSWAVERNLNWVIVLESDAMWDDSVSNSRVRDLMQLIQKITCEYLFVNISGGFNLNELGFKKLKSIDELNGFVNYNAPIVNTACAYLINYKLAKELLSHTWKDHLGIDWIYNIGLHRIDSEKLINLHMNPEGLIHGSFSGGTVSWQQNSVSKLKVTK